MEASAETIARCPVCGGEALAPWVTSFDKWMEVSHQRFTYSSCGGCGALVETTRPTPESIGLFYPEDYAPHAPDASKGQPRRRRGRLAKRLFRLSRSLTNLLLPAYVLPRRLGDFYAGSAPAAALLDYGCGSEVFLDTAKSNGWDAYGTDASEATLARVRAAGHHALPVKEIDTDPVWVGRFDVVRLNHVIEHVYDPVGLVGRLHELLRPGGRLHVATPNPASLSARLLKGSWHSLDCPRHLVLFPPKLLCEVVAKAGFQDVELVFEAKIEDLERSLSYWLTDRGLRRRPHSEMASFEALRWLTYPAMRLLAAFGTSDRFHVFARKPQ